MNKTATKATEAEPKSLEDQLAETKAELIIALQRGGRAYTAGFDEGFQESAADDEPLNTELGASMSWSYRDATSKKRDLSSTSQEQAIAAAYRLWNTHPLMKAITEILVDYVIGVGVEVNSDFPDIQKALDRFTKDPVNKLDGDGLDELVRELSLYGEQLLPVFVRSGKDLPGGGVASGLVRYGSIDPSNIKSVITAPDNRKDVWAIRLKTEDGGKPGKIYRVIQQDGHGDPLHGHEDLVNFKQGIKQAAEDKRVLEATEIDALLSTDRVKLPVAYDEWLVEDGKLQPVEQTVDRASESLSEAEDPMPTKYDGSVFWFTINSMSTGLRGRPDLLSQFDWLDRFDQLFFDAAEHVSLLNIFAWHLQIEGGSETAVDPESNIHVQLAKMRKLKSNSVYATNEKIKLEPKNPELRTTDVEVIVRQLRNFISGGARIPEHWVSEGGYTNRATAEQMGVPTFRMLTKRQTVISGMLTKMCQFQIDVLVSLGKLPEEVQPQSKQMYVPKPVPEERPQPKDEQPPKKQPAKKQEAIDSRPMGDLIKSRDAFTVDMPDINLGDTRTAAIAFELVSRAVVLLRTQQLLPDKTSLEILEALINLLGIELDVEAVLDEIGFIAKLPVSDLGFDTKTDDTDAADLQTKWDKQFGPDPSK